jgi:hypothetical protein
MKAFERLYRSLPIGLRYQEVTTPILLSRSLPRDDVVLTDPLLRRENHTILRFLGVIHRTSFTFLRKLRILALLCYTNGSSGRIFLWSTHT